MLILLHEIFGGFTLHTERVRMHYLFFSPSRNILLRMINGLSIINQVAIAIFFRLVLLLLLLQIMNSAGENCSIRHIGAAIKQAFQVDFFVLEFVTHEFAAAIYVLIFMFIRQKFYISLYANTVFKWKTSFLSHIVHGFEMNWQNNLSVIFRFHVRYHGTRRIASVLKVKKNCIENTPARSLTYLITVVNMFAKSLSQKYMTDSHILRSECAYACKNNAQRWWMERWKEHNLTLWPPLHDHYKHIYANHKTSL